MAAAAIVKIPKIATSPKWNHRFWQNLVKWCVWANLPTGLYILLALISSYFSSFNMSKAISVTTEPIFTIFSPNGRYLRIFSWSGPVFPIPQGTLPWQPILCQKQNTNHVRFFCNFYTVWKHFWCRWQIWNFFFNISRDVAMATNFVSYQTCSLGAEVCQDLLDRFSQSLHRMVGIWCRWWICTLFSDLLRDVAMATH